MKNYEYLTCILFALYDVIKYFVCKLYANAVHVLYTALIDLSATMMKYHSVKTVQLDINIINYYLM